MKKLLLFAALVLGMASCQTEPEGLDVVVGGEQEVMLSVSLPESTRGESSAGFNFYDFENNSDYDLRFILEISHNGKVDRTVNVSKTTSTTFPIRLAPDRNYTFTVWADLVNEGTEDDLYYNILTNAQDGVSALSNITIKEWTPNVELRDAYTFTTTKEFKAGATDLTMTLERPFAKVRVVATDIEDVTKFDIVPDKATVTYTVDMYTKYNAVGVNKGASEVDQNVSITYPIDVNAYDDEKENGQLTELTVFADYIFVPADGIIKFDLVINDGDAKIKENNFNTAIPVVANKVTSIVGDVLTHGGNVSIDVNSGIDQNETINYVDSATTLQEIINDTAEGESANITLGGDIDLNDLLRAGTLSTRAGETAGLVIPANKTVVIDLKGYTISYSTDTWNKHMIENNGNLTLKGEGTVAFTFTGDADTTHGKGNYAIVNNGTLTIEGATVSAKASKVAEGEKFSHALYTIQMSKGAMTLESGSIINYNGYAVRQFGASDITVNGGMVKGTRALWIQLPGSDANVAPEVNVTVNGGTLIGTGETGYKLAIYSYSYGNDMANVNIAVTAGTIEGDIALTGGNNKTNIETLAITGGTLSDVYSYGDEKAAAEAITITGGTFSNITPLAYLNTANEVVTLNSNVENAAPVKFAGEGTLNLNGHNVTAVDTTEAGYGLITNNGNLTITGKGKMTLSATTDSGWSRYSSVISNGPNGTLTVNEDVTIEHIGGTSMAYGIDVLTNGGIGDSHATVYGTVKSKYRAIRQFLNSDVKMNTLIVKEGATVESTGGNKAIWMQDPSKKANKGKLVVESGANVHSVYLDVTEGSTEWPVEVSVAASSLTDQSENKGIYTDNIPAGYAVVNENGIWTISYTCAAKIGETEYNSIQAAFEAAQNGDTIVLQRDINLTKPVVVAEDKTAVLDLNGKTIINTNASENYGESEGIIVYGNLTIEGEGTIQGASMAVWARGGDGKAVINIEGGTFLGCQKGLAEGGRAVIYASSNNTVNIYGGEFKALSADQTSFAASQYPVLNVADNKGMINVYGGRFHNQNPAAPGTEPKAWNEAHPYGFVAEGYGATEDNGVWTVAKAYEITDNVYTITSAAGLFWVANEVNSGANYFEGKTIKLGADIDLNNAEWTPIGSAYMDHGFMGNFDGNGKTIKNLTITNINPDADGYVYAGLFGVTEGAENNENYIKNLVIENVNIALEGDIVAAAIAYPYYTTLENITVKGNVSIKGGDYTSGVLAYTRRLVNANNIVIAANAGSIEGKNTVGGVISDIQTNGGLVANYSNFVASGLTIEADRNVGGISGIIAMQTLNGAKVENVTIVSEDARKGSLAGALGATSTINDAVVNNVTGVENYVGATYKDGSTHTITINGVEYEYLANGLVKVNGEVRVADAESLTKALAEAHNILMTKSITSEATAIAPYGNKYGYKMDGGVLNGNGHELYMECYGDDYGIMTAGGTIKNLTIKEGCRAVMIMYPQDDIILDNVNIGGDGVLYPINTGEKGAEGVKLVVTNSTLAGWTSYGLIESASFTDVKFEQGTYYTNIYGRVLKPYVNTTLTNCSFVAHMNLDLSALVANHKIVMKGCTVDGQAVTAETITIPTTDAQYDTELFTIDLPSWATSVADCVIFE